VVFVLDGHVEECEDGVATEVVDDALVLDHDV
jgi:hypothetical protein